MQIKQELKKIGLTKSETEIYVFLLQQGISSPPQIARGTHISRTNCYHILFALQQKGLIEPHVVSKRKVYRATDPSSLLDNLEKQKNTIEQIIPDLRGLYNVQKNKPIVQFFDGWQEMKSIYEQSLDAQEIFAIGSPQKLSSIDTIFFQRYIKEIQRRKIVFHDIMEVASAEGSYQQVKELLKGYYDATVLPRQYNNIETDILVWEDTVAFVLLEEPLFGTILVNKQLARTCKMIFTLIKSI